MPQAMQAGYMIEPNNLAEERLLDALKKIPLISKFTVNIKNIIIIY